MVEQHVEIEITRFAAIDKQEEKNKILAKFNAKIAGFQIRNGCLRESNFDGAHYVTTRGVQNGGDGIALSEGPMRDRLRDALLTLYREGAHI